MSPESLKILMDGLVQIVMIVAPVVFILGVYYFIFRD